MYYNSSVSIPLSKNIVVFAAPFLFLLAMIDIGFFNESAVVNIDPSELFYQEIAAPGAKWTLMVSLTVRIE